MTKRETFGQFLRREREAQNITLRKFAEAVKMSPTYLSKVERDELPPPAEEKVNAIARTLRLDPDELLGRAGRVATDLETIIQQRPRQLAVFLRSSRGLSDADLEEIISVIQRRGRS
jgi:transcriptional regulator with XRE-family HTH domain